MPEIVLFGVTVAAVAFFALWAAREDLQLLLGGLRHVFRPRWSGAGTRSVPPTLPEEERLRTLRERFAATAEAVRQRSERTSRDEEARRTVDEWRIEAASSARSSHQGGVGERFWVQVIFSAIILGTALYIIVTKPGDAEAQRWASGAVGVILGFWLRDGSARAA